MTLETSKGTMAWMPQQGHVELTGAKVQVTNTEHPGQTWSLPQLKLGPGPEELPEFSCKYNLVIL